MGRMKQLAIEIEECAAKVLDVMGIEPGSPAWNEYYLEVVQQLDRWVSETFLGAPTETQKEYCPQCSEVLTDMGSYCVCPNPRCDVTTVGHWSK